MIPLRKKKLRKVFKMNIVQGDVVSPSAMISILERLFNSVSRMLGFSASLLVRICIDALAIVRRNIMMVYCILR